LKFTHRRAVSPIIATLLLIAIAVAAGIVVYVYVNSLAGGLTGSGGQQVSQQLQMQAYNFAPQTYSAGKIANGQVLDVFLENTGSSSLSIANVYFDGTALTEWATTANAYGKNLYLPNSAQNCFALIPSTVSLTFLTTPITSISGTSTTCTGSAGVVCNTTTTDFCAISSAVSPPETGMTAVPLAAQSTVELVVGLNFGSAVTSGTSHSIKIVTLTGGQEVFTVVAGKAG
jgi:flagellin-like protein